MICPNCQSEFPDGVKFCSSCGTPLAAPVENAVEAAAEVKEEISQAVEAVPEVQEVPTEDMPSASFDPGAPIAIPKQADESVSVSPEIPSVVPEVSPIEEVLPEYPQTVPVAPEFSPAPVAAPADIIAEPVSTDSFAAPAPVPTPVAVPAPAPVLAPAPISLTPETVPAPVVGANESSKLPKENFADGDQKVLKTGTAFWLSLLFAIPVIGLIFSIIFAASGKKCQSRKNFAKAALIWHILLIVIALSLIIVCHFMAPDLFDAVINGSAYDVIDELDKILPFIA